MASDDFSTVSAADDENYGFRRQEMYQSSLAGTVGAYDRHVFLCYKTPEAWPSHLETSDSDVLPRLLCAALKARKDDISVKVCVDTIDVVCFPIRNSCFFGIWRFRFDLVGVGEFRGLDWMLLFVILSFIWFCQTKLTMFAGREETGFLDGDVLIFPEMVKYR